MRMRSTGLGKTELVGEVVDMVRVGDYLILHMRTTEPVSWHVRAAFNYKDLLSVVRLLLKPSNLRYLLLGFAKMNNSSPPPQF